jgi:hypothetical protein
VAAEAGERNDTADPITTCMVSNLDLRKAEEVGALVAASGDKWLPTLSGGIADLQVPKVSESSEHFSAALDAESLIMTAISAAAEECGIEDAELEVSLGAIDGLERGVFSYEFLSTLPGRGSQLCAAFLAFRSTLLKSQEFQRGYQRVAAELELLKGK